MKLLDACNFMSVYCFLFLIVISLCAANGKIYTDLPLIQRVKISLFIVIAGVFYAIKKTIERKIKAGEGNEQEEG